MEPVKYMRKRGQRQEQNTTSVTPPKKRQRDWGTERERKRRGEVRRGAEEGGRKYDS